MHKRNIFCGFWHATKGLCEPNFSSNTLDRDEGREGCLSSEPLSHGGGNVDFQALTDTTV